MTDRQRSSESWWRRALNALPVIIFALALAFSWVTAYVSSARLLDSDASSELVLAKLLSQQNSILTTDWIYSNELRVVQTNLVFAPLFKLFTDWHMVRFVGIMVLQALMVLAYRYLCRRLRVGNKAFFLSASLLVLPYSIVYGRIVLYHTYYLPFVAMGFWLVGLYLSVLEHRGAAEARYRQPLRVALLLTVSLLAGLNGVRLLMVTLLPLLASAVLLLRKGERKARVDGVEPAPERWRGVLVAMTVCAFGAVGYLINAGVLSRLYTFRSFGDTMLNFESADGIRGIALGYLSQFGFQTGRKLFSLEGVLAVCGLLSAVYLLGRGMRALAVRRGVEQEAAGLIRVLFPVSLLTMAMVFMFTEGNDTYALYFIPAAVWAIPLLAVWMHAEIPLQGRLTGKRAVLGLVCAAMLMNGVYNGLFFMNPEGKPVTYDGLGRTQTDAVPLLSGAVKFLTDNGYTLGYATYWNANILTEMTDGDIAMVNLTIDKENPALHYYDWLTDLRNRDPKAVEGRKAFILLEGDEDETFLQTPLAEEATLAYEDEHLVIFSFDSPTAPLEALEE